MTRTFHLIFLLASVLSLSGCFTSTEEIWIEADGSGRHESQTDMSGLYPFLMMGITSEQEETLDEAPAEEADGEEDIKDNFLAMLTQEELDTVFSMRNIFQSLMEKEGISEDQFWEEVEGKMLSEEDIPEDQTDVVLNMIDRLMHLDLRFQASSSRQELKSTTIQSFTDPSELSSWMKDALALSSYIEQDSTSSEKTVEALEGAQKLFSSMTRFELDGNYLHVHRQGVELPDISDIGEGGGDAAMMIPMLKMFFGDQPYRLIVHLPGRVRKIDNPDVVKIDRNTVMYEIPMEDLFDPETEIDFTVKFRRPRS